MCWSTKVDMELLTEFTASRSPNYKHGTPDGVQLSKCPNSSHPPEWVDRLEGSIGFIRKDIFLKKPHMRISAE